MILKIVSIEKERYLSKDKAVLLRAYIIDPFKSVLAKKLSDVNATLKRIAITRQ